MTLLTEATGQLLLILVQLEMFYKLLILLSVLSCVLFCSLHATPHLRHTHLTWVETCTLQQRRYLMGLHSSGRNTNTPEGRDTHKKNALTCDKCRKRFFYSNSIQGVLLCGRAAAAL